MKWLPFIIEGMVRCYLAPPTVNFAPPLQVNGVATSASKYGNRNTFTKQPDFCFLLEKLWKKCGSPWKRSGLDSQYPELCALLRDIEEVIRWEIKQVMWYMPL